MNPTHGVMPIPVAPGSVAAIDPSSGHHWPGLASAADQIGVCLSPEMLDRFARYADLLQQRNAQFNLTAVRDRAGIERLLFLNALAMATAFDAACARAPRGADSPVRMVDVGAGGGFPGLPLKIARPDIDLTLIDSTAKKTDFLNEAIAELGLLQARAVPGRAEALGQNPAYREQFDIGTARAVAGLPVLLEYVMPFLAVGGTALLPKGLQIDRELRAGRQAATMVGAAISTADRLPIDGTRLVVALKTSPTPSAYPRRVGLPSRSPLGEGL